MDYLSIVQPLDQATLSREPTPTRVATSALTFSSNIEGVSPDKILDGVTVSKLTVQAGHIQSSNYEEGLAGWKIDSNGEMEMSSGTFRATLSAASGTLGTITGATITGGSLSGVSLTIAGGAPVTTWIDIDNTGLKNLKTATSCSSWLQLETSGAMTLKGVGVGAFPTYINLSTSRDETLGVFSRNVVNASNPIFSISGGATESNIDLIQFTAAGIQDDLLTLTRSGIAGHCLTLEANSATNTDAALYGNLSHAGRIIDLTNGSANATATLSYLRHTGLGMVLNLVSSNASNTNPPLQFTNSGDAGDIHFDSRASDPSGGSIGDVCVVLGKLKICTDPGTWVVCGTQT